MTAVFFFTFEVVGSEAIQSGEHRAYDPRTGREVLVPASGGAEERGTEVDVGVLGSEVRASRAIE